MPNSTSGGCCSTVIRRFLCGGSMPTHPADVGPEICMEVKLKDEDNAKEGAITPGVVARLMGLDSIPTTQRPKDRTLASYFRSKSVDSIDFLCHFDPVHHHRRLRSSVSFREGILDDYALQTQHLINTTATFEVKCQTKSKKIETFSQDQKARKSPCKREERKRSLHVNPQKCKTRPTLKETRPVSKTANSKQERKKKKILAHKLQSKTNLKRIYPEGSVSEAGDGACSSKPWSYSIAEEAKEKKVKETDSSCYKEIVKMAGEDVKGSQLYPIASMYEDLCLQLGQEILQVLLKQLVGELVGTGTSVDSCM